jgi:integral membrane sensor domain MASE1
MKAMRLLFAFCIICFLANVAAAIFYFSQELLSLAVHCSVNALIFLVSVILSNATIKLRRTNQQMRQELEDLIRRL